MSWRPQNVPWRLINVLLGLLLLAVAVRNVQWSTVLDSMADIRPVPVLCFGVCLTLSLAVRSLRWTIFCSCSVSNFQHFWRSTCLGYMYNYLLPMRAGEVVRVVTLSCCGVIGKAGALAGLVVDRLADITIVMFVAALSVLLIGMSGLTDIHDNVGKFALILVAAVLLLAGLVLSADRLLPLGRHYLSYISPTAARVVEKSFRNMAEAILRLQPRAYLWGALLSLTILTLDLAGIWFMLKAMGMDLPLTTTVRVFIFFGLGAALPSTPGNIGMYQLASILALAPEGITKSLAVAFSFTFQLCSLAMLLLLGGLAMRSTPDKT